MRSSSFRSRLSACSQRRAFDFAACSGLRNSKREKRMPGRGSQRPRRAPADLGVA